MFTNPDEAAELVAGYVNTWRDEPNNGPWEISGLPLDKWQEVIERMYKHDLFPLFSRNGDLAFYWPQNWTPASSVCERFLRSEINIREAATLMKMTAFDASLFFQTYRGGIKAVQRENECDAAMYGASHHFNLNPRHTQNVNKWGLPGRHISKRYHAVLEWSPFCGRTLWAWQELPESARIIEGRTTMLIFADWAEENGYIEDAAQVRADYNG